jgi:predicted Fe-Mo cluster-binding NifX family protein
VKIAIAALQKGKESEISAQAGKSPLYLIFNERGELLEELKNPFTVGGGGAGFGVAKMLADREVDAVAAGKFGANMTDALRERGIRAYEMKGVVRDALETIR